jgi:hypothetical protein
LTATKQQVDAVAAMVIDNWDSIGVEEHDGILHMPAAIKRRNKAGGIDETRVMLRAISNPQRYRSRTAAREWAQSLSLDLDRDADLCGQLENYCILAFAIRDADGSFVQHVEDGPALFKLYGHASLSEVWGRYDAWIRMQHPGFGSWDAEQMWQVIARIKGGADLTPLAVMPGIAQANCLLFMASQAACSTNAPSWLRSSATSTPAA